MHTEKYENGTVKRTYTTLNGVMDGTESLFYPNGTIQSEIFWHMGTRLGPYTDYYENGKVKEKGENSPEGKVGEKSIYYPNGNINKTQKVKNGLPNGAFTVFFPNGKIYINGNYVVYALDGSVKLKKTY